MNSWKLNGRIGHLARQAIINKLNIKHTEIYKEVLNINNYGIIECKNGKQYILELKEI